MAKARKHVMTPARRAALKRAQRASAAKRRGKGKGKLAAANRKIDSAKKTSNARGRLKSHFQKNGEKYFIAAQIGAAAAYYGSKAHAEYGLTKGKRSQIRRQKARESVALKKAMHSGIRIGREKPTSVLAQTFRVRDRARLRAITRRRR